MTAPPREPSSIGRLVAGGVLDAELGSLLWLLVEARLPFAVVGSPGPARSALRDALLEVLPADADRVVVAGDAETFAWLPEAVELGWRRDTAGGRGRADAHAASPHTTVLLADLDDRAPGGTWGTRARIVIRALALGYPMAATMTGGGLDDVLARLKAPPVSASDDELSRLGAVLVLSEAARGPRLAAVHYLRPVVRDASGHVQRLPPAVLATWDPRTDQYEHFAWGLATELADRTGRRPIDFEREQARRVLLLDRRAGGALA